MYNIALCDDNENFLEIMEKIVKSNLEYESNMICTRYSSGAEVIKSNLSDIFRFFRILFH